MVCPDCRQRRVCLPNPVKRRQHDGCQRCLTAQPEEWCHRQQRQQHLRRRRLYRCHRHWRHNSQPFVLFWRQPRWRWWRPRRWRSWRTLNQNYHKSQSIIAVLWDFSSPICRIYYMSVMGYSIPSSRPARYVWHLLFQNNPLFIHCLRQLSEMLQTRKKRFHQLVEMLRTTK